MDTEALRTFVAIARMGGFSGAADQLGRSQPAISRRIALLEGELRMPVFERLPGGVELSQAGQTLLPHAERVLAALEDASAAMRALQAGDGGPVSVAVVGTLAGADLAQALKQFAERFPKVALTLRTATSAQVSDLVRRGEATFGLRYFEDVSPDLENRACAPEALVVVCAPEHPLAGEKVASLRDLKDEPWLGFPPPEGRDERWSGMLLAQFLTRGVAEIPFTAVDSLTAQKRLVEAGFGLALMPVSAVAEERAAASLAAITVADLAVSNPVSLITRKAGYVSPAALALIEALAA
ncbi:LysR family transcriptional regulator [Phenylobacterium sp.]|uniref:LysR family transcriptional regulator n=1 Tax=Phenylobacterium sp. TaxID=1871053 RepID=UPI0030F41FD9